MHAASADRDDAGQLQAIFAPRSIAVIGASTDATKIGGLPIAYLQAHGYDGAVYPITIYDASGPRSFALRVIGVSMMPGQTALTPMPAGASCDSMNASIPALCASA